MKNKLSLILILFFSIFVFSCWYKKIIEKNDGTVAINEVKINGDKRVGYIIKNDIFLSTASGSENLININLNIKKFKEVKNKNVSGKIEKYSIRLDANVEVTNVQRKSIFTRAFSTSTDYEVMSNHSDTISNEKNAVEISANQISEDIVRFINIYFQSK